MIRHLKFIFVWISLMPQLTDSGSVTWNEPTPVKTTSNPAEVLPPGIVQVYEGSSATLNWSYSLSLGLGLGGFLRFSNDRIVDINRDGSATPVSVDYQKRYSVSSTLGRISLSISAVTVADDKADGEFSCSLFDASGDPWKRVIQVQVLVPVQITAQVPVGGDQIVPEGGNLQLFCNATGRPTPDIFWTKVLADGSSEVSHDEPTWNFTNIDVADSGTYSCVADNKVENPKRGQKVKVIVNATVIITDTQKEHIVAVGESVTLNCEAKGNPLPSYTWTPCGQDQFCNKSTFVIPQVSKDANYTCKAANEYTSDSKSSNVFIGETVINITLVITSESCDSGEYDRSMLFKKLSEAFDGVFAIKFGYENVKLIDVRCGSIEVDLALHFNSTTKEKDVITELRNAVKDGKFGEFNVSAIVGTRRNFGEPTTKEPTTAKGSSNTAAIVGGSVGGALLCLGAGAGGVVYYKKKQDEKKKKGKNPREVDTNGGQGRRDGDQKAGCDDNYADVGPGAHFPRKGGNVGNEQGTLEYAVVDKTKKKKKTPKPGELQYAELGELTVPGQKTTMPRVSGTDTVYADVRS